MDSEDLEDTTTHTHLHRKTYLHVRTCILTPPHHQPPQITRTISYNAPPARAAALNIQTNCPSSSACCRKRHKARAARRAGLRVEWWQPWSCSKKQHDNVLAALCLSASIMQLVGSLFLVFFLVFFYKEGEFKDSEELLHNTSEHPGHFPFSSCLHILVYWS